MTAVAVFVLTAVDNMVVAQAESGVEPPAVIDYDKKEIADS